MGDADRADALREQVLAAAAARTPLRIHGAGSKGFVPPAAELDPIATGDHRGILGYEPSELVITARAGTPLIELEQALAERGQMLACEPPQFNGGGTLGGLVASGLSGPRRPWGGAVRDLVLGVRLLDGRGRSLRFGGEVMKNVAGYDISRLSVGAFGTLGLLLDVSIRVAPRPAEEHTLILELTADEALALMQRLQRRPLPFSAIAHVDGRLYLRLACAEARATRLAMELGAGFAEPPVELWRRLADHRLAFFDDPRPLWRLSLAAEAPLHAELGDQLLDWGGAQRWLLADGAPEQIQRVAAEGRGHARCLRGPSAAIAAQAPLGPRLQQLHRRIRDVFDPQRLFNRDLGPDRCESAAG